MMSFHQQKVEVDSVYRPVNSNPATVRLYGVTSDSRISADVRLE